MLQRCRLSLLDVETVQPVCVPWLTGLARNVTAAVLPPGRLSIV